MNCECIDQEVAGQYSREPGSLSESYRTRKPRVLCGAGGKDICKRCLRTSFFLTPAYIGEVIFLPRMFNNENMKPEDVQSLPKFEYKQISYLYCRRSTLLP